jgi:hypothetical protein
METWEFSMKEQVENEQRANSGLSATNHEERRKQMRTVVVNIHEESFDVYIGRTGRGEDGYFGNPFRMGNGMSREDAVDRFQKYFAERIEKDSEFKRRILALKGKRLGCFCKPKACHGDVIAEWLNKMEPKEVE